MSNPTITVLMTVYNGGEYLRSAMESILRQTYADFEFLIINDCSRDQSVELISSFADPRIRLISNETNLGQTRSLNKGLSLARGRYIARIDADDLAFPCWLEKNLNLIQAKPKTAVVSCKAVVINSRGEIQKILNTPAAYEQMILKSLTATPINHVGSLYKTDVITSVGGYDESFKIAADYELWSNLIRKKIHLESYDEPLVAIRVHEKSVSITERGRTDVREISEVMVRNFKSLTTLRLTDEAINGLWKLCYATGELNEEEFKNSLALLQMAYENMNADLSISSETGLAFAKNHRRILYTKKAFSKIAEGHWSSLRSLTREYQKSEGHFSIFSLMWLGSWMAPPVLKFLPRFYDHWNVWSTKRKLRQQSVPEFIH